MLLAEGTRECRAHAAKPGTTAIVNILCRFFPIVHIELQLRLLDSRDLLLVVVRHAVQSGPARP